MKVARDRRVEWLVVAMLAAACSQPGTAQTTPASRPASGSPLPVQAAGTASGGSITLEFDVPAEFATQQAGSTDVITGFRVGYFWANELKALRTVDVARDAVTVKDRTARVTIPLGALPECGNECTIRLQTLTRGRASVWSAAAPLDPRALARLTQAQSTPPRQERQPAARPGRAAGAPPAQIRQRQALTLGAVERYPRLTAALRKLFPENAQLETELGRFRRVQDLALAVVVSRNFDLPFADLSRTLEGPPPVPFDSALTKLRPGIDGRGIIRKSRPEARTLLESAQENIRR